MKYNDIYTTGITASEDLTKGRFVSPTGGVPAAGENSLGVAWEATDSGERATVICIGACEVEADGAVALGDGIAVGTDGKAKKTGAGDKIVARPLNAAADGEAVFCLLITN